ncbi:MAG: AAA family ATPase [Nitrososphaerota archaeon]
MNMPPLYSYHGAYVDGLKELFDAIILPKDTQRMLSAALLSKNFVIELTGTYGVAKSTFALSVMKMFFRDLWEAPVKPIAKLRETLTEFDVFWYVDIAAMQRGDEEKEVRPRPIVTAPFKFINEIRRGSPKVYQTLLSLLAEGELEYKGRVYRSADYICIADSNPKDTASVEMPKALIDRIDVRIFFSALGISGSLKMLRDKFDGVRCANIIDRIEPFLTSNDMRRIWDDVERVEVPNHVLVFLALFHGALQCVREYEMPSMGTKQHVIEVDRTIIEPYFQLQCDKCQFNGSLCSRLKDVWGVRWMQSTVKAARGLAWLDRRPAVSLGDILFVIPYALNHRLILRDPAAYPNAFTFIKLYLPDMLRLVGSNWAEAARLWARYLRGDREALSGLRSLSQRDSAIRKLYMELEKRRVSLLHLIPSSA